MAKINVYGTESYSVWICREPIEIDTDNYPELNGMSEDEIKEYIRENSYDMKSVNDDDGMYSSFGEQLYQTDIRRDKNYNEEMGVIFDGE